jgi:hypothetical protein
MRKLYSVIEDTITSSAAPMTVTEAKESVCSQLGELDDATFKEALAEALQRKRFVSYSGSKEQTARPDKVIGGSNAIFHTPKDDEVLVTVAEASQRGWIEPETAILTLDGRDAVSKLFPLLSRLGALYHRGGKSTISMLQVGELALPGGGTLRIDLLDVTPESMKQLDELFEVLADKVRQGANTFATLEIKQPVEGCALIDELKKSS